MEFRASVNRENGKWVGVGSATATMKGMKGFFTLAIVLGSHRRTFRWICYEATFMACCHESCEIAMNSTEIGVALFFFWGERISNKRTQLSRKAHRLFYFTNISRALSFAVKRKIEIPCLIWCVNQRAVKTTRFHGEFFYWHRQCKYTTARAKPEMHFLMQKTNLQKTNNLLHHFDFQVSHEVLKWTEIQIFASSFLSFIDRIFYSFLTLAQIYDRFKNKSWRENLLPNLERQVCAQNPKVKSTKKETLWHLIWILH